MKGLTLGVRGLEALLDGLTFRSGVRGTIQDEDLRLVTISAAIGVLMFTALTAEVKVGRGIDLGVCVTASLRTTTGFAESGALMAGCCLERLVKLGEQGTVSLGFCALAT